MQPIFALILCSAFVLYLLRLESRQSHDVSIALWVPTAWLLLVSIKPLGIWFGMGGSDMEAGSPLDRNIITILIIMGLIILAMRRFSWVQSVRRYPSLYMLVGYMFISTLWSDMPYVSLKRCIRNGVAPIIMAFIITSEKNPQTAVESIMRRVIYVLIPFSYILVHYFPEYGREYGRWTGQLMWIGVATQKNGLAGLCLLTIIYLIWSIIRRGHEGEMLVERSQVYVEIFILSLAIWLFMGPSHSLTYSATSTAALVVGLITLINLFRMKKRKRLISANTTMIITAVIVVLGTITPFSGGWIVTYVAPILNRQETLTGRTDIWEYLIPYAMDKIILGHGYGGFWTDAHRAASSSHAHNGYLDIILDLGLVGLALFSLYLLQCCRYSQRIMMQDFEWGSLCLTILIIMLVHNIGESSLTSLSGLGSALILFLLMSMHDTIRKLNNDMKIKHIS